MNKSGYFPEQTRVIFLNESGNFPERIREVTELQIVYLNIRPLQFAHN